MAEPGSPVANEIAQASSTVSLEDVIEHNQGNNDLDMAPVAVCDGNLKMVIYISSSQKLDFTKNYSAGLCDRDNPNIWLDHDEGSYNAKLYVDLATCHEAVRDSTTQLSITQFNTPLPVSWQQQKGNGPMETIQIKPQCLFTSNYIVDKVFSEQVASTVAVIGQDTAHIEDNLSFDFQLYTDGEYTDKADSNELDPHGINYIEVVPASGFNMYYVVSVPTACYVLQDNGAAFKVFSIPQDPICDYPKIHDRQWGTWKFAIDMGDLLQPSPSATGGNYKIECAIKTCPNTGNNECSRLIDDCNYPTLR